MKTITVTIYAAVRCTAAGGVDVQVPDDWTKDDLYDAIANGDKRYVMADMAADADYWEIYDFGSVMIEQIIDCDGEVEA